MFGFLTFCYCLFKLNLQSPTPSASIDCHYFGTADIENLVLSLLKNVVL
jgi:hypothetical protein